MAPKLLRNDVIGYVFQRLALAVPTLVGVAIVVFLLMRIVPGDVVTLRYEGGSGVDPQVLQEERARLGLDRPLLLQFTDWIWGAARGDLGLSMWTGRPIAQEIAIRLELTLQLAIMALIISVLLA